MFDNKYFRYFVLFTIMGVFPTLYISCTGGSSSSTDSPASDITLTGTVEIPSNTSASVSSYLTAADTGNTLSLVSDTAAADCTCRAYTFEGVPLHDEAVPVITDSTGNYTMPVSTADLLPTSISDATTPFTNDVVVEVTCNEGAADEYVLKNYVAPSVDPTAIAATSDPDPISVSTTNVETDLSVTNMEITAFTDHAGWGQIPAPPPGNDLRLPNHGSRISAASSSSMTSHVGGE
jgi:hypothetical protein